MSKKNKIKKLDAFYYHEALDRAYIVANLIQDLLIEHPVVMKHKNLKRRVKRAQQDILEVYQIIGGLEIKLFPEKQKSDKQ